MCTITRIKKQLKQDIFLFPFFFLAELSKLKIKGPLLSPGDNEAGSPVPAAHSEIPVTFWEGTSEICFKSLNHDQLRDA